MARQRLEMDAQGPGILDGRYMRAMALAPARDALLDQLAAERGWASTGAGRALVVGGGHSPIAAGLRDRGFQTTSIDSSAAATALAAADAPEVDCRAAPPSALQVEPASFDLVYCADTLEITEDLDGVLAALAAAARPGATLVLDTVTDTFVARLIYLVAFQLFPWTRVMPRGRYHAVGLRRPRTLERASQRVGISVDRIQGFEPRSVGSLVRAVLDRRAGRISDAELPAAAGFRLSRTDHAPVVTYFAIATRSPSSAVDRTHSS